MALSVTGVFQKIVDYIKALGRKKQIIAGSALLAIIAGAIITAVVLNKSSYTVLYRGLSAAEGAEVISILDGFGTQYRVEGDGTVYVPTKDEAVLKMKLASEGYPKSTLSYDVFSNGSALMTTDYEKRQYLIFQLQNRLQDAIKTLQGISNAIVTLNVADDSAFVLKSDRSESSASVVLDLNPSVELTKKQIQGIESLVVKSVSGLDAENVVIIDGAGNILNGTPEDGTGGAYSKLEMVNTINRLYEQKIDTLLAPVLGKNGMSVLVNVVVDFRQKTSEETTYSPVVGESGIVSHHEYNNASTNGGAVAGGVVGIDANSGVPSYQETTGDMPDGASATASGTTDYLVNRMIQTIIDNGGSISDMTIAVVVNARALPEDTREKYRELIAFGTGVAVEKVAITNAEFLQNEDGSPVAQPVDTRIADLFEDAAKQLGLQVWALYLIAAGVALIIIGILWIIIGSRIRRMRRAQQERRRQREAEQAEFARLKEDVPGEIVLNETREQVLKKQIRDFSTTNPEIVAQLLRAWMKERDTK